MKRLVCLLRGHAWEDDPDVHESYPVIRCERCGKHRELTEKLIAPQIDTFVWDVGQNDGPRH